MELFCDDQIYALSAQTLFCCVEQQYARTQFMPEYLHSQLRAGICHIQKYNLLKLFGNCCFVCRVQGTLVIRGSAKMISRSLST